MIKPPYDISGSILNLFGKINDRLGQTKGLLLLRPEARLRRENRIKTIHASLGIEGNTLELQQVTAILDNKRVVAPAKDIVEVRNAIQAYGELGNVSSGSQANFLKVHALLMQGLVDEVGKYRSTAVGIVKGAVVKHLAPAAPMVPSLMGNLFSYLNTDSDSNILKSCVFHYEMEFIHPFQDGNGRMGRYWQTRILMNENPIFEYLPIEAAIKERQTDYYQALAESDNAGKSTRFIEFMLERILEGLDGVLAQSTPKGANYSQRVEFALSQLTGWFDRKQYLAVCKNISTATATRDLKQMVESGLLESSGKGRTTRYRKRTVPPQS